MDLPAPIINNGTDQTTATPKNCPNVWDAIGDLHDIEVSKELFTNDSYCGKLGTASDYAKVLRGEAGDPQDRSRNRPGRRETLTGFLRTSHTPETISRFANTEQGHYESISRFFRLAKDGLAPTIRAGTGKDHGSYMAARPIHPVDPRCITVREAARLHSFPDWFKFHPTRWHGFRQIGNSVPPLLARAVACSVYSAILKLHK
jgi:DNA (cytosine-5)-methyltransferase 1